MIASQDLRAESRRKGRTRRWGILFVTLHAIFDGSGDIARAEEPSAHRADLLKAGYLLNFVKFVEWPASVPAQSLTVCFIGGQGVLEALASGTKNKAVGERYLSVRKLADSETPVGCNVLYLDAARLPAGMSAPSTANLPILTVSDARAFARSGGMIELFVDADHLRFNINLESAQKAGLRISSSLLQLAAAVEQAKPP